MKNEELIDLLRDRFEANMHRHKAIPWAEVDSRLESEPDKLQSLAEMERTGGEPDVVGQDKKTGEILYYDCSPESPDGRRSLCYDAEALEARKKNKPEGSAVALAEEWGAQLLSEEEYRSLQKLGPVDQKTSSWLRSPPEVRDLGGAIFGDYRFGRVFIYHNGAESYYAARGFRCVLRV
jgi:Protein of unknown function (DUF4256)